MRGRSLFIQTAGMTAYWTLMSVTGWTHKLDNNYSLYHVFTSLYHIIEIILEITCLNFDLMFLTTWRKVRLL